MNFFPFLLAFSSLPFLSHNISSTSGLKELALVKRRNILVLHLSSCSKLVPTEIQARLQRSQLAWLRSSLDPLKPVCSAKCFQWRERANAHTHTHTHTYTQMRTYTSENACRKDEKQAEWRKWTKVVSKWTKLRNARHRGVVTSLTCEI